MYSSVPCWPVSVLCPTLVHGNPIFDSALCAWPSITPHHCNGLKPCVCALERAWASWRLGRNIARLFFNASYRKHSHAYGCFRGGRIHSWSVYGDWSSWFVLLLLVVNISISHALISCRTFKMSLHPSVTLRTFKMPLHPSVILILRIISKIKKNCIRVKRLLFFHYMFVF